MSENTNDLGSDPLFMTLKQKVNFFEKNSEKDEILLKQLSSYNNLSFASKKNKKKQDLSSSDNNASSNITYSTTYTSTPTLRPYDSYPATSKSPKSHNKNKISFGNSSQAYSLDKPSNYESQNIKLSHSISLTPSKNTHQTYTPSYHLNSSDSKVESGSLNMKEFHEVFRDLDSFLVKELNEVQTQKRIGVNKRENRLKDNVLNESDYEDRIFKSLKALKDDIEQIKENQKEFENKIQRQEIYQRICSQTKKSTTESDDSSKRSKASNSTMKSTPVQYAEINNMSREASSLEKEMPRVETSFSQQTKVYHSPTIAPSSSSCYSRDQRIRKLENEIYKEETLMMKINRVLENVKNVDDRNLRDIINIERHYLVASTRFQSALSELRKLNDNMEISHLPPYNRKGKLLIREIMLEVKQSYFERPIPTRNEFLLVLMKYEDKVFATKPMRITDDVRIIKFSEKFSIPEIYMDFDMRLEIYGTTFWRKSGSSVRETMLKKYGFITFSLADTNGKSKRFNMIEVLQSDNVPIRSSVRMKISQKITTNVQYVGTLYVKLREAWHEAAAHLNGHLLEITFNKTNNSSITQSHETMLLDLYNIDSDAAIQVDSQRISEKPYTFLLKFNHYVDIANFYLMVAAMNGEEFSEWINAINKVLVLIK